MSEEAVTVAVLILDNYDSEFHKNFPNIPFAFVPVANIKMINYALDSLASSSVREAFLCCREFYNEISQLINEYIKNHSKWSLIMKVSILSEDNWHCVGDVLRCVYNKGIIRNDFILMHVNSLTNADLSIYLKLHKDLHKTDSNLAMTLLLSKNMMRESKKRLYITDFNDKILYLKLNVEDVSVPVNIGLKYEKVKVLSEFTYQTGVMICSPKVLSLFLDNFDFRTLDDFIMTLLRNQEVAQGNIYVKYIDIESYLGHISDWCTYRKISVDILNRQLYPLVPDDWVFSSFKNCICTFPYVYRCSTSKINRSCKLKKNVFIGENVIIDRKTLISNSIIGENCKIGANCSLINSVIFPNNSIKNNSKVYNSVILSANKIVKIDDDIIYKTIQSKLSNQMLKTLFKDTFNTFFDINKLKDFDNGTAISMVNPESDIDNDIKIFQHEIMESLIRGFNDKLSCDNLLVEINSSRYAYNISVSELNISIIKVIMQLINNDNIQVESNLKSVEKFNIILNYFGQLIDCYIKSNEAELDCLNGIYEYYLLLEAETKRNVSQFLAKILLMFYQKNFISEETILIWIKKLDHKLDENFRNAIKPFIIWLEEAEEESD